MKPKILFILHMPPPVHGAAVVGKYIHDSEYINSQVDARYIHLGLAENLSEDGKASMGKIRKLFCLFLEVYHQIKEFKPEMAYVTASSTGGAFLFKDFWIVQMLKSFGCKVIVHYHNKGIRQCQHKLIYNFMYKYFFRGVKVILLANELYDDIKKYVNKENVIICPNGVPAIKSNSRIDHDGFNILFLSNMLASKGVYTLLEACGKLKKRGIKFHCDFIGKWDDVNEECFISWIKKLNISDCVVAHGAKYGDDKSAFFQKADVFVFPTFYSKECFPLVLLEAMQWSLPCIGTDEGGIPSIIEDGKTGFIIKPHDYIVLADKIQKMIEKPRERKQMGYYAKEKFEQEYTLHKFERNFLNCLFNFIY